MIELNQEAMEKAREAILASFEETTVHWTGLPEEEIKRRVAERMSLAAIRTYLASLPPVDAEPVAWMDEWGELSYHKPSINPEPLYPAAAIIALQQDKERRILAGKVTVKNLSDTIVRAEAAEAKVATLQGEVQELNKLLADGANGRTLAAEAEVARLKAAVEHQSAMAQACNLEVLSLKAERDELQEALDLRWKADMRAITEWREVTGRELTLPDHIDLVHFLLMGLDLQVSENQKAEAEVARLKAELAEAHRVIEPFATLNEGWVDEEGWTDKACQNDRICDWLGPSDFRRARSFRDRQKTGEATAICKSCGQSFPLSAPHDCPGLTAATQKGATSDE